VRVGGQWKIWAGWAAGSRNGYVGALLLLTKAPCPGDQKMLTK